MLSMIKHIEDDCNLFNNNSLVEEIKHDLMFYQEKIGKLKETVLSYIENSDSKEYRKNSAVLLENITMLGKLLWDSKIMESYTKLYIRYHLGDLSNLFDERSKYAFKVASQLRG